MFKPPDDGPKPVTPEELAELVRPFVMDEPPEPPERTRNCLRCDRPFQSSGPSNRLCGPCRKLNEKLLDREDTPVHQLRRLRLRFKPAVDLLPIRCSAGHSKKSGA